MGLTFGYPGASGHGHYLGRVGTVTTCDEPREKPHDWTCGEDWV